MALLRERIETPLAIEPAFAYIADFVNAARWDPGVESATRLDGGPVGVGARYRLRVRMGGRIAPMDYEITHFEPTGRVVLAGRGSSVTAVDDITFTATARGTQIDYTADIRLGGLMRLVGPFAGAAFRRIARDAMAGMERTLDELARAGTGAPASAT